MVKEDVIKIIKNMDDDNLSLQAIMYELKILEDHNKAMKNIADGDIYTSDEVLETLAQRRS